MYCSFCGKQIRDGAVFCSECGRNLTTGNSKIGTVSSKSSNKVWIPILAGVVAVVLLIAIIGSVASPSIVGVWMDGTSQVVFTKDGDYKSGANYGTYTITSDKTLEILYGEYSYNSGRPTYKWGPEAKEDSDYWYISGGTLYFRGGEYTKK